MAMQQQPVKTSSAHRSTFVRGTHTFEIIGYGKLKALGVRNTVRSGDFEAGGHTWALVCCFDVLLPDTNPPHRCQLTSISLKLVSSTNHKDVIAKASLRIDDPAPPSSGKKGCGRRWPPAVWESGEAHSFPATTAARFESYSDDGSDDARSWRLSVPDAFRESLYVKDDRLTIHCTVDVLLHEKVATAATRNCFVSVVPPPTIPRDLRNLLFLDEPGTTTKSNKPDTRFKTDGTFVVEQTEIHAHRLVLAMRSPVFAAELFGEMKEGAACARVTVDDMSASTFKAMLYFIYTDELLGNFHKPKQDNDVTTTTTTTTTTTKGLVTMVGDLLVAADRYDLERLRLMCEKILAENMDAASAMTTLMLVHGRDRCRQLEAACIEYMASNPSMYADVVSSKEYKEIKERCGPFVTDVLEKVWRRALTRDSPPPPPPPPPSSSLEAAGSAHKIKSASMFNSSAVFSGSHEFRIPDFNMMHKIFGVSEHMESSPFQVGGREWIICVYPSGYDGEGFIAMSLQTLTARGPTTNINTDGWVTATFKMDDPTGKMPPIICWAENLNGSGTCFLVKKFMDVASTELFYVKYDGSLTIQCDVKVSKGYSYSTSPAAAGSSATMTAIIPPSSNIACHLERLLLVSHRPCFDVKFLVQDTAEVYAHELVIAARSPVLHRAISSAPDKDHVQVDDMDVTTFRAMLHFIYADELPPMTMTTMTPVGNHRAGDNLVMARDMLVAADRFGLDRMKAMCENMLCEHVMASNVVATLELADRRGFQGLKDFCLEHISQPHVLKEVAETQSFKDLKTTSPGLLVEIIIKISKLS